VKLAAALAMVCLAVTAEAAVPSGPASEYAVKAAYLFNFARFVEWPPEAGHRDTLVIGILGTDPFGSALDQTIAGKSITGRTLTTRHLGAQDSIEGVDILFVCSSEASRLPQLLKRLDDAPVLTVGDLDDFASRGGMVGFVIKDDTVRFDVNLDRIWQSRLKMSSQLVKVARRVIATPAGS
jgi:hypothetical protein